MCTEFFLVIIYFFIILTINYFFFKLLRTYWLNILELNKFKNMFTIFKSSELLIVSNLYLLKKVNSKNISLLRYLNNLMETNSSNDILWIGNLYKFLNRKFSFESNKSDSNLFYFRLLEKQYLNYLKN